MRPPLLRECIADCGAEGIDRPALDPASGDNRLTPRAVLAKMEADILDRLALGLLQQMRCPVDLEPTVAGRKGRQGHTALGQRRLPRASRAQPRPGGTAQSQHGRRGPLADLLSAPGLEKQRAAVVPAGPAVAVVERHPQLLEPRQPRAQQGRSLEAVRKHATAAANEGALPQPRAPVAQVIGREVLDDGCQLGRPLGIARDEGFPRFGMGDVEPAQPSHEQLSPR
ncbi:MAG: Uncharacterised protein [Rhodospirillaceae bacterium]|nr:MAG: Uncharacterised protein [Rhodospirillaceae bacterium]